jgi:hypothetical protein
VKKIVYKGTTLSTLDSFVFVRQVFYFKLNSLFSFSRCSTSCCSLLSCATNVASCGSNLMQSIVSAFAAIGGVHYFGRHGVVPSYGTNF